MTPICPPDYVCTFTPKIPTHPFTGPWYNGTWGIVIAGLAITAIVIILCTLIYWLAENAKDKRSAIAQRDKRSQAVQLSEQFSMQLDSAKGNEEILKIVKDQQREWSRM